MKTSDKIVKKGYKLRYNIGKRNGEQCVVSITALRNEREVVTRPNVTKLYAALK